MKGIDVRSFNYFKHYNSFNSASFHVVSTVAHEKQFVDVVLLLSGHGVAPHDDHTNRGGTATPLLGVLHSLVEELDNAGEFEDGMDLVAVLDGSKLGVMILIDDCCDIKHKAFL